MRHAWSLDDAWLAYVRRSDERLVCVEAVSGREMFTRDAPPSERGAHLAAVSPDALLLVTRGADDVRVCTIAVPDGGVLAETRVAVAPGDLAVDVSSDGAMAVVLSGSSSVGAEPGCLLTWLDTRSLTIVGQSRVLPGAADPPRQIALHPDGTWVAWVRPVRGRRPNTPRELERVDRSGAIRTGPLADGGGEPDSLRWVGANRLLVGLRELGFADSLGTRVLFTDPERGVTLYDSRADPRMLANVDVHPEDGRLLLARHPDPELMTYVDYGDGYAGHCVVVGQNGFRDTSWKAHTAFPTAYGAVWANDEDGVIELGAYADGELVLGRRRRFGGTREVLLLETLRPPPGGEARWDEPGGFSASIARSPGGRWLAVRWAPARRPPVEHLSWLAIGG
jgi:hypothetical protein